MKFIIVVSIHFIEYFRSEVSKFGAFIICLEFLKEQFICFSRSRRLYHILKLFEGIYYFLNLVICNIRSPNYAGYTVNTMLIR
jgi:hypothetical protein